ncbi:hypothetical protein X798_08043 [Onchocerca flexuosa]|uniref:Uncharacterized protein n=2 Tax=Onchocerca flexuosa TaxID=387005 RepID=A0A183H714_9BILA|nr:hypothetical protein X798_08043 [Onchocerca flexuosa]VDO35930.1 unnamed protein product [Onchocerca flexuosa]
MTEASRLPNKPRLSVFNVDESKINVQLGQRKNEISLQRCNIEDIPIDGDPLSSIMCMSDTYLSNVGSVMMHIMTVASQFMALS